MRTYVIKRVVIAGFTLLGMSMLIFFLMRLAPGNITDIIFESAGYVDQADKKRLEVELGFDKSIPVQYVVWLRDFLSGNLGKSYRTTRPPGVIKPRRPSDAQWGAGARLLDPVRRRPA
jgi:peptide/nickel transport system permease protein